MTDESKPLPIPMLPANDERRKVSIGAESDTEPGDGYRNRAKAEWDALKMMEHAKAMMRDAHWRGGRASYGSRFNALHPYGTPDSGLWLVR